MNREEKKQKIGILGGTFDPVHEGHLAVARSVLDRYKLDQILFVPAFLPPHKERKLTPFLHRVAMLELCLQETNSMSVSMIEAERKAPSYTVDTLKELHLRIESGAFYLIIGADMFIEIELWYRFRELFKLAHIIVAARPGISKNKIMSQAARLPGDFQYDQQLKKWSRNDGATIHYCTDISETVSSSEIRNLLKNGKSVSDYLTEPVEEYIKKHKLYGFSGNGN